MLLVIMALASTGLLKVALRGRTTLLALDARDADEEGIVRTNSEPERWVDALELNAGRGLRGLRPPASRGLMARVAEFVSWGGDDAAAAGGIGDGDTWRSPRGDKDDSVDGNRAGSTGENGLPPKDEPT